MAGKIEIEWAAYQTVQFDHLFAMPPIELE